MVNTGLYPATENRGSTGGHFLSAVSFWTKQKVTLSWQETFKISKMFWQKIESGNIVCLSPRAYISEYVKTEAIQPSKQCHEGRGKVKLSIATLIMLTFDFEMSHLSVHLSPDVW